MLSKCFKMCLSFTSTVAFPFDLLIIIVDNGDTQPSAISTLNIVISEILVHVYYSIYLINSRDISDKKARTTLKFTFDQLILPLKSHNNQSTKNTTVKALPARYLYSYFL